MTLLTPGEYDSFQSPSWSPDGRSLAYDFASPSTGATRAALPADAEIYVMDLATGSRRQLTDNKVADVEPDWSPDGSQIVFVRSAEAEGVSHDAGRVKLMIMASDGATERLLFDCPSPCGWPRWSPDGDLISLAMDDSIWTIRRDGSDLHRVSGDKVTAATYPAWSPDGRRLAYWATLEATSVAQALRGDLAVLDLNTGEETIVLSGLSPWNPDWSPLGSMILFSDQPAPQKEWTLFTLDLEAGVAHRLIPVDLEYDIFHATWSPDAKRVAFAYGSRFTRSHLYILDIGELEGSMRGPTTAP